LTLTYYNQMVSKSSELRLGVCHEKVKSMHSYDGTTANRKWHWDF